MAREVPGFRKETDGDKSLYNEVYKDIIKNNMFASSTHNSSVVGTLRGFIRRHGVDYAVFQPSIVYEPSNKARVNKQESQELMMPFEIIRPIYPNDLEKWVKQQNKTQKEKEAKSKQPFTK